MRPASRRRPCSEYGSGGWPPLRMGGRTMVTYSPRRWRTPPPLPLHSLKGGALLVVPMNLEEIQVAELPDVTPVVMIGNSQQTVGARPRITDHHHGCYVW